MGSPARASSSTTEPWANCKMYLIGTLVRPNSTDSCTGISSTILMSLTGTPEPEGGLLLKLVPAGEPLKGPPCSASSAFWVPSTCFCSSRASAQSENGSSPAGVSLFWSIAIISLRSNWTLHCASTAQCELRTCCCVYRIGTQKRELPLSMHEYAVRAPAQRN